MYDRDGGPRPSWFDPLGFAGLAEVTPPPGELEVMEGECRRLEARQGELERLIADETLLLRQLGVRLKSMDGSPHLASESARLEVRAEERTATLTGLRRERAENDAVLEELLRRVERPRDADDARAHIRRAAEPVPPSKMRFTRVAELWAALSISALLVGLAVLILASPSNVWAELVVLLIAFVVGESVLRGTFVHTVNRVAVILALVAVIVLFVQYWQMVLVVLLIGLAVFLLYQRFLEFRA
jgi:hypothetical protein